jgi:catechol 2,3-dioxygenase-like lactoylglutathione lyase family enzyme
MRLRLELFVDDLAGSVAFYIDVLGFRVHRRSDTYASLGRGAVALGLVPFASVQQPSPTARGVGVEVVLEVDSVDQLRDLYLHCQGLGVVADEWRARPWGLQDFRLYDPDGYYIRVTHGNAAREDSAAPGAV